MSEINTKVRNKKTHETGKVHDTSLDGGACLVDYGDDIRYERIDNLDVIKDE